jgi:hypothetical protein
MIFGSRSVIDATAVLQSVPPRKPARPMPTIALRDNIVVDSRKAFQHHQAILARFVRKTEHRECDVSDLLSPGQNQTTAFSDVRRDEHRDFRSAALIGPNRHFSALCCCSPLSNFIMPVGRLSLRHALIGRATATLLWEMMRHILAWYYATMSQNPTGLWLAHDRHRLLLSVEIGALVLPRK